MPLLYRLRRSASSDRAQLRCPAVQPPQPRQPQPRLPFAHAPRPEPLTTSGSSSSSSDHLAAGLRRGVSLSGISGMVTTAASASLKPPNTATVDARDLLAAVQKNDAAWLLKMLGQGSSQQMTHRRYQCSGSSTRARKMNVNQQLRNGMSALHQAAFNGSVQMLRVLLDHGARVDLQDSRGLRPLHVASFQGHFDAVHMLLKWNSSINSVALGALTALHLACQGGHYDVVKLLLCNNADPMLRTEDGRTSFDVACEYGHYSISQLLMSMKSVTGLIYEDAEFAPSEPSAKKPLPSCLHLAAKNGHTDVLRLLLGQSRVNVNRAIEQGTCLHLTVCHGHIEATRWLLERGIDPNLANSYGQTAKDLITHETPHARELHQMLSERLSAVEATATRDFCDLADPRSIAFRCGERVTVLERSGPTWKGYVTKEGLSRAGYFPGSAVEIVRHPNRPPPGPTGARGSVGPPPPSLHVAGAYHHHHPCGGQQDGLVPCAIPMPPAGSAADSVSDAISSSSSPPSGANRNSAASLDSGRSSSHTATSSDTRSVFAPTQPCQNNNNNSNNKQSPVAVEASSTATSTAAGSSCGAGVGPGARGSQDSGLGPRQSLVSTCSSGSLGSLPDDNASSAASVSSAGDCHPHHQAECPPAYRPEDWHRAGLTNEQQLAKFLNACQFGLYLGNFADAGYDLATLTRCCPEDLNAAGLTNPKHRKRLRHELGKLALSMRAAGLPDPIEEAAAAAAARPQEDVGGFCRRLGLPEAAAACLRSQGFAAVHDLVQMAWEDLEEIGISKLGHQKKLMLAIDRLKRPRLPPRKQDLQPTDGDRAQCTTTDIIIHSAASSSPDCSTVEAPQAATRTVTFASPAGVAVGRRCHSDYLCSPGSRQSPATTVSASNGCTQQVQEATAQPVVTAALQRTADGGGGGNSCDKPVAKILGRPAKVPEPPQPLPPPLKVPPPPPKRVTSVRQEPGVVGAPQQQQQQQKRAGAYENADQVESAVRHQLGFLRQRQRQLQPQQMAAAAAASRSNSVASIPFANENCGTIVRHKQQQQQQQQQQQPIDQAKGAPEPPQGQQAAACEGSPAPGRLATDGGSSQPKREPLLPPAREDSFSNLDDICDMLSDLQSILDKELKDHQQT